MLFRVALVLLERAQSQLLLSIAQDSDADTATATGNGNGNGTSGAGAHEEKAASDSGASSPNRQHAVNGGGGGASANGDGHDALPEAALLALNSAFVFNVLSDQPTALSARVRRSAPGDDSECARFVADLERYRERVTGDLVDSERLKLIAELMELQGTYSHTLHAAHRRKLFSTSEFIDQFGLHKIIEVPMNVAEFGNCIVSWSVL